MLPACMSCHNASKGDPHLQGLKVSWMNKVDLVAQGRISRDLGFAGSLGKLGKNGLCNNSLSTFSVRF